MPSYPPRVSCQFVLLAEPNRKSQDKSPEVWATEIPLGGTDKARERWEDSLERPMKDTRNNYFCLCVKKRDWKLPKSGKGHKPTDSRNPLHHKQSQIKEVQARHTITKLLKRKDTGEKTRKQPNKKGPFPREKSGPNYSGFSSKIMVARGSGTFFSIVKCRCNVEQHHFSVT